MTINEFFEKQAKLDTLKFIACGSVDDGKSTLIGRLLHEAGGILDDQLNALKLDSKRHGTQGDNVDFALLVDGLAAEREQGITIDVAYRFFSTSQRKFIVADTPGHKQYTRNMATGASTTDLALILVDARQGILEQTRRHSIICSMFGIKKVVLAINKIDLAEYSKTTYQKIIDDYQKFAGDLNFEEITPVPMSALKGDNVTTRSSKTPWYTGPTLLGYLETVDVQTTKTQYHMRYPVQWVNRPNHKFRGFSGIVESGTLTPNQRVRVLPSGQITNIKDVIFYKSKLQEAHAGQSVTVTLEDEVDVSRGDVLVDNDAPCEISDQFQCRLVWMDHESGYTSREYYFKLGTNSVNATITSIKSKININSREEISASQIEFNDICIINLKLSRPIPFENFTNLANLGSFILINKITNQVAAAGIIEFGLRRAKNIHIQHLDVDKIARRNLAGHTSKVIWFTGLSGSGKSTLANALEKNLFKKGMRTYLLDGDNVRHGLNSDLGFTERDRIENIRRIAEVSRLMVDAGVIVITAFISPFAEDRQMARNLFNKEEFIEVYVNTPLQVVEKRDVKGLYKKARAGEIPNFTGINSRYDVPLNPEITVSTADQDIEKTVDFLLIELEKLLQ